MGGAVVWTPGQAMRYTEPQRISILWPHVLPMPGAYPEFLIESEPLTPHWPFPSPSPTWLGRPLQTHPMDTQVSECGPMSSSSDIITTASFLEAAQGSDASSEPTLLVGSITVTKRPTYANCSIHREGLSSPPQHPLPTHLTTEGQQAGGRELCGQEAGSLRIVQGRRWISLMR